jgi:hypothetical protein
MEGFICVDDGGMRGSSDASNEENSGGGRSSASGEERWSRALGHYSGGQGGYEHEVLQLNLPTHDHSQL